MRTFFLLLLLAGLALGFGYPVAVERFGKAEIGRYRGYDRAGGYRPVEVPLKAGNAPVGVDVEMTATGPAVSHAGAVLTLVVDRAGRSVLAAPLDFAAGSPRETNPQNGERIYSQSAGSLTDIDEGVTGSGSGRAMPRTWLSARPTSCCGAAASLTTRAYRRSAGRYRRSALSAWCWRCGAAGRRCRPPPAAALGPRCCALRLDGKSTLGFAADHREADRPAEIGLPFRLAGQPFLVDQALVELDQRQSGRSSGTDVVGEQMDIALDGNRGTVRAVEMRGQPVQQEEWMIADQHES